MARQRERESDPSEEEEHMQSHEGAHGTFLELKAITQVYKLFTQ